MKTGIESRLEERQSADGRVSLLLNPDGSDTVECRLVDVSNSGFRAVHRSRDLSPGRVVRFELEDDRTQVQRTGWARLVWSRLEGTSVESGFFIVISD